MAKIKINGKDYETDGARTILDVTRKNGIEVPTFCYNPELSIAANCRMCLVEVKGAPKLMPACQTDVRDGMEVLTASPKVKEWQAQNLEFILLHHPVDCPICDQAGECQLQEHYQKYDRGKTRLWSHEDKLPKSKRKVLGPHVIHDAERCILCTQCVRFCHEIWGEHLLDSQYRGDHREIIVAHGQALDFPYSLMVVDVCPVGAMTSRDFRFAKRVWMLHKAEGFCAGCATGCAAYIDSDEDHVYRLRPRRDDAVNRVWLCDDGVLSGRLHNEDRVTGATAAGKALDERAALREAARLLEGARGQSVAVLSAEYTTEDNLAMARFATEVLGATDLYLAARPDGEADRLLRSADKNPNRAGATAAAGKAVKPVSELAGAEAGFVVALGGIGTPPAGAKVLVLSARKGDMTAAADVLLPAPTFAQCAGTYFNAKGMARSFGPAIAPKIHEKPLPTSVAGVLDGICAAMGVAHRTGDLAPAVAKIAASLAVPADDASTKEGAKP